VASFPKFHNLIYELEPVQTPYPIGETFGEASLLLIKPINLGSVERRRRITFSDVGESGKERVLSQLPIESS
jgi:hypothetical protein